MDGKDTTLNEFLWSLSGFKKDIIAKNKVDSFHAAIIGALLFIVGIYAVLAWTFFFQTVSSNPIIPVIAGLFMGFYIVSFDRALIASMSSGFSSIFSVGFRLLLATLLGIFLAQPMILKFYQSDVKREAQILVDKKNQERKKELELLYSSELTQLNNTKAELQSQLTKKQQILSQAESDFKKEMDGSAGTGKWGYNTVSKRKEKILNLHQDQYSSLTTNLQPKIDKIQHDISTINSKITLDFESYKEKNTAFGTLIQAEALESLLAKDTSGSLRLRYYLLAFILALIELSALIAKMLFKMKSYKSSVSFINEEEVQRSENNKEVALEKLEAYKNLALESELELMHRFFDETKSTNHTKMDEMLKEWKSKPDSTYKEIYELFRSKFVLHDS